MGKMKPVKPKIVSKDNSSPSAKEQIKLTKYGKVELTPLAKKLIVFAEEEKSVLLYGDYASDLYVFMNKFHKEMNDKNPLFKYVGKENMPEDFNPDEYLATEMRKAIENRKHKKIYELFRDFKRTENTYLHIDCQNDDGETVLKKLTGVENFTQKEVLERISSMMKHNENWETFYADIVDYKGHLREKRSSTNYFCEPYSLSTSYCRRRLLAREGTLFVENLICEQDNPKDKASYERLAAQIKKDKYEGEDEGVWSISLSGWLVVCAYDFTTFPQRFLDQFVMVPLDAETIEGDEPALRIDSNLCTLGFKSEVKLEPIVFALFELLFENKDSFVTTKDIHNSLWPEKQNAGSVYDQQIYQHIGILRTALKGIGIEGEIITTTSKSKFKKGGYIFHGNMIH